MSKISGYANSVSALGTDDLLDVSEKISSSPDVYESRKMTGATLATFIQTYVTPAAVGNTTAQWNADSIEGNTTNLGTLGAGQDGYALTWDNGTSRFIAAAISAPNIYTDNGTIGTGRVATLTDTLDFQGNGRMIGITSDTLINGSSFPLFELRTDLANNGNFADVLNYEWRDVSNANALSGHGFALGSKGEVSQKKTIGLQIFWDNLRTQTTEYFLEGINFNADHFNLYSSNNKKLGLYTSGNIVIGGRHSDTVGSEIISLLGRTLVKGAGTAGTNIAFEVYDSDTTPNTRFEIRSNGDIYTNGTQGLSATYTFGGGTTGDIASMTYTNGILTAVTTVP